MKHSKKLFILFVVIFFGVVAYLAYDISSRTTFPGSNSSAEPSPTIEEQDVTKSDSLVIDIKN